MIGIYLNSRKGLEREKLKKEGFSDEQISSLMRKGICLVGKSRSEVFNESHGDSVCDYCGEKIVAPNSVFVTKDHDKGFCSWECVAESLGCTKIVFNEENTDYTRFFPNKVQEKEND